MRLLHGVGGSAIILALCACASSSSMNGPVATAYATVEDAAGHRIGVAAFGQDESGAVNVRMLVHGLTPGMHGVHVHATGSCVAPGFTSAAGHFNPGSTHHGLNNPLGPHAGDLPNMNVDAAGNADYNATTRHFSLTAGSSSVFDADGSALVVHAGPDDNVSDPAGNSGARIACGVIQSGIAPN